MYRTNIEDLDLGGPGPGAGASRLFNLDNVPNFVQGAVRESFKDNGGLFGPPQPRGKTSINELFGEGSVIEPPRFGGPTRVPINEPRTQTGGSNPSHNPHIPDFTGFPRVSESFLNGPSCLQIVDHVKSCPLCSKFYENDKTIYIVIIVVLAIISILLLKRILDL